MIPDFQSCMLPFLRKLEDGSVHSMTEIQNALIREFHLTETDVKEMLPSNRTTRFRSNVGWAKTHMQKAGLLETPHVHNIELRRRDCACCKLVRSILI